MNTTVSSIALFVNNVLTQSYRAVYGSPEVEDNTELILIVAPLAANAEIQQLYSSGLIDIESALPSALHSLGCSSEEIGSAMERRRAKDAEEKAMNTEREKTEKAELKARTKFAQNPKLAAEAGAEQPSAPSAPKPSSATDSDRD